MTKPTTTTTTPTTNGATNPQQPHKRRRRRRSTTKPAKPPTPPASTDIDHWFQSGPFSALPQGASPAEVEADLKRIRAAVARLANILLGAAVGIGGISPVCEAQQEQEEALFVRGVSLSPRKEGGRGRSPGTAAEPLTPESFYGEDTVGEREKERKRKARREAEAAPRVRSPTGVRRERHKGSGGVPARKHRARFSPYTTTT
ncbi:uncharacterized protein LAJ45_01952 [Morchella importuna]|uniref:Uncharacterized protein n=1 Tax=Morchella conica CCBAS932 TaxID=1392247 RepID=A0A3N4L8F3_9PEZI|nr:uncharacterized protein LAJ45_01952 [Morchella importuna]KAH8154184.1 hypothetical protein LAJ45_01952 [Morchella importuna]RPB16911.1 hypothetical protein P167DRAFT_198951 [Morchella conica CCBAS932]